MFLQWFHIYVKFKVIFPESIHYKDMELDNIPSNLITAASHDDSEIVRLFALFYKISTQTGIFCNMNAMSILNLFFENLSVDLAIQYLISSETISFISVLLDLLKSLKPEGDLVASNNLYRYLNELLDQLSICHKRNLFVYNPVPLIKRIEKAISIIKLHK